jgi:hypothetical protein
MQGALPAAQPVFRTPLLALARRTHCQLHARHARARGRKAGTGAPFTPKLPQRCVVQARIYTAAARGARAPRSRPTRPAAQNMATLGRLAL